MPILKKFALNCIYFISKGINDDLEMVDVLRECVDGVATKMKREMSHDLGGLEDIARMFKNKYIDTIRQFDHDIGTLKKNQ